MTEEATEAMLMTDPPPWAIMPGRKARHMRYIAVRLRSTEKAHCASSQSRMVPAATKPAQLKSTSGPGSRATMAAMRAGSRTSRTWVSIPSAASVASVAGLMSVATTRAPSRAIMSADARPIPCPAAVTSATLPSSRPIAAAPRAAGAAVGTPAQTFTEPAARGKPGRRGHAQSW